MKIEQKDDEYVIYLLNTFYTNLNKNELIEEIKNIFIRLCNYHNISLKGICNVYLYDNLKYGTILEISNKDKLLFPKQYIDINLKIFKNKDFYFKTNNYFILNQYKNIYYNNNYYYINLKDIDNYLNILEHGILIYNEKDNYLNRMTIIK